MFASAGYFRGVTCPYFGFGLCERPNCHFRHIKTDETKNDTCGSYSAQLAEISRTITDNSSASSVRHSTSSLSAISSAIKQVSLENSKRPISRLLQKQQQKSHHNRAVPYNPTPIAHINQSGSQGNAGKHIPISAGPQYNPTPIEVLRKQKLRNAQQNNEYDPVSNCTMEKSSYSTSKRLTLGDGPVSGKRSATEDDMSTTQTPVKKVKTCDPEPEIEAKFSDDEETEMEIALNQNEAEDSCEEHTTESDKLNSVNKISDKLAGAIVNKLKDVVANKNIFNLMNKPSESPKAKTTDSIKEEHKSSDPSTMTSQPAEESDDEDCMIVEDPNLGMKEEPGCVKAKKSAPAADVARNGEHEIEHQITKISMNSPTGKNDLVQSDDSSKDIQMGEKDSARSGQHHSNRSKHSTNDNSSSTKSEHKTLKSADLKSNGSTEDNSACVSSSSHKESTGSMKKSSSRKDISKKSGSNTNTDKKSSSHKGSDKRKSSHKDSDKRKSSHKEIDKRSSSNKDYDKKSSSHKEGDKKSSSHKEGDKKSSSHKEGDKRTSSHKHHEKRTSSHSSSDKKSSNHKSDEKKNSSHKDGEKRSTSSNNREKSRSSRDNGKTSGSTKYSSSKDSYKSCSSHKESSKSLDKHSSNSSHRLKERSFSKEDHKNSSSDGKKSSSHKENHKQSSSSSSRNKDHNSSKRSTSNKNEKDSDAVKFSGVKKLSPLGAVIGGDLTAALKEKLNGVPAVLEQRRMSNTSTVPSDKELFGESDSDSDIEVIEDKKVVIDLLVESDDDNNDFVDVPEEKTLAEPLPIINDYKVAEAKQKHAMQKQTSSHSTTSEGSSQDSFDQFGGQKRVAHSLANQLLARRNNVQLGKRKVLPTPSQVLQNRYLELKKREEAKQTPEDFITPSTSTTENPSSRLAHSPPRQQFLSLKRMDRVTPSKFYSNTTVGRVGLQRGVSNLSTPCATAGTSRVAHTSKQTILKRPTIAPDRNSKIPTNIRQKRLNLFINECLKIYDAEKDAYSRAVSEEQAVYDRGTSKVVYMNASVGAMQRLRKETLASTSKDKQIITHPLTMSHAEILGGKRAQNTSFTIKRSGKSVTLDKEDLTGASLYNKLKKYILKEDELRDNGFPRSNEKEVRQAIIYGNQRSTTSTVENEMICCRCGTTFRVYPDKPYPKFADCVYHWGKAWKKRIAGAIDNRYTCCGGDLNTKGCQDCPYHVHDSNKANDLKGYVKTRPGSPNSTKSQKVYALDCEMVYTAHGLEIARVTVIDDTCKTVYEQIIKPKAQILDYNTRFSGLTESDLQGVTTSIRDVQAVLRSMFNSDTILLGHSLESDFVALKLIHSTVVDTSVVFPHNRGPPFKRALRNLMTELLQKIIQEDDGGHDSREDAVSCMELMIWKVKEDSKLLMRRS